MVDVVKAFLILAVAALHLVVVPWSIWFDELMPDAQLSGGGLEQYEKTPFAVGEAISELKAIVGLDTLHLNAPADIPFYKPFQEISRGIGHAGQDRSSAHRVWADISSFPYHPKTVPAFA